MRDREREIKKEREKGEERERDGEEEVVIRGYEYKK